MAIDILARAMTRRGLLSAAAASAAALPIVALTVQPAAAKVSQSSVAYQPTPKDGHSCSNCTLFEAPKACKSVDGEVSPDGWCRIWVKKA